MWFSRFTLHDVMAFGCCCSVVLDIALFGQRPYLAFGTQFDIMNLKSVCVSISVRVHAEWSVLDSPRSTMAGFPIALGILRVSLQYSALDVKLLTNISPIFSWHSHSLLILIPNVRLRLSQQVSLLINWPRSTSSTTTEMQNPSCLLYGSGDARFEDRPLPEIEDPHDVIIRIAYTGVCGSDVRSKSTTYQKSQDSNANKSP